MDWSLYKKLFNTDKNKILWNYAQLWKLHLKFLLSCLNVHNYLYIQSLIKLLKIKLQHARKRSITVVLHTSALTCLTSLLRKARCYKATLNRLRLQSWRNPKGGILSTEVVFSIFWKFSIYIYIYILRWAQVRAGPFPASWAKTEWSH